MKRYHTESAARAAACAESRRQPTRGPVERYVIESAPRPQSGEGRYVVDDDGFTRSWERTIAVYFNGQEEA